MKLLRRFTNKGKCRRLIERIENEKEYLQNALIYHFDEKLARDRQWLERFDKMTYWLQQLTK